MAMAMSDRRWNRVDRGSSKFVFEIKSAIFWSFLVPDHWIATSTVDAILSAFEARTSPLSSVIIHHCHGAAAEVAPEATAFGMRRPHFTALIYAAWTPATSDAGAHRQWARQLAAGLASNALPGGYANLFSDDAADQITSAFGVNGSAPGATEREN
jgi:hypothetical protein